jgi:hypothetical protein
VGFVLLNQFSVQFLVGFVLLNQFPVQFLVGFVLSSCSTNSTGRVILATNPVISHESGKDRIVIVITEHIRVHV